MKNKTALITGGGSGIGRATALAFAQAGASVIVVDLSELAAAETVDLIKNCGGRAEAIVCNVADPLAVETMFKSAVAVFGGIDCAFNNAGVTQIPGDTADITTDEWNKVLAVNASGIFYCMREELKHMVSRQNGSIVNTASFAAIRTIKSQSAYVTSKHAVAGLTQNAAVEYAGRGIRINAICPGGVITPMFDRLMQLGGMFGEDREAAERQLASMHPMMRTGEAQEIANAAVFLCSEKASFITGICLPVDGGWAAS